MQVLVRQLVVINAVSVKRVPASIKIIV